MDTYRLLQPIITHAGAGRLLAREDWLPAASPSRVCRPWAYQKPLSGDYSPAALLVTDKLKTGDGTSAVTLDAEWSMFETGVGSWTETVPPRS